MNARELALPEGGVLRVRQSNGELVTPYERPGHGPCTVPVTLSGQRRPGEVWSQPRLVLGPDGVPWLFYRSDVRRMVFYHRWTGDGWSQRFHGGIVFHAEPLDDGSFLENRCTIDAIDVAREDDALVMRLGTREYPRIERTHRLPSPLLSASPGEGELFLDTHGVAGTEGLAWHPAPARRPPANPVLEPTFQPGTPDEGGVFNHGTVLHDGNRFRAWYGCYEIDGHGPNADPPRWDYLRHVCYAESDDGIRWQRVNLGLVDYGGSRNNNLLPAFWMNPTVVRDDHEPDPALRYKSWEQTRDFCTVPGRGKRLTSPDGVQWTSHDSPRRFPGTRPHWFVWQSVFRDDRETDPDRRWKAYGYYATAPHRRAAGVAFSPDGVVWTCHAENPILEGTDGLRDWCHDLVVWREGGLYAGLLQVADSGTHNYEYELVVSRDGVRFSRAADGTSFVGRGAEGAWDHGPLCMLSQPVFLAGETRFYYGARDHAYDQYDSDEVAKSWSLAPHRGGFASIPTGRYAGFMPRHARTPGRLLTCPIRTDPARQAALHVNAACPADSELRVEILDADSHRPVGGCAAAACSPITTNGVAIPVHWGERPAIDTTLGGSIRLCFELRGRARLYGFTWASTCGAT